MLRAPVGGLFRHVGDLTAELAARGHAVGIVADTEGDARTEARFAELGPHASLGIHRLPMPRVLGLNDVTTPLALNALARRLDIDVVHGHGAKGGFAARLVRVSAALARGYMRNPNVAIEVAEYRPFFIQGQVNNGGQFPYVYGMTVRAAVSTAGGFKDTADQSNVTIYRRQTGQMMKSSVNLDFPIKPGDTIVIGERWF